jgi:hypothetical protein
MEYSKLNLARVQVYPIEIGYIVYFERIKEIQTATNKTEVYAICV